MRYDRSLRQLPLVCVAILATAASAQLSGTYTVNPMLPASGTNFQSLGAATTALIATGVSGPVTIEVYDDGGDYTETAVVPDPTWVPETAVLVFDDWAGASAVNRVTFKPGPGERPVLDGTGRGFGIFWNGGDYVTVEGFEITNPLFDAISFFSTATTGQAIRGVVRGCVIHEVPSAAIVLYGNTPAPDGTLIENNLFYRCATAPGGGFGQYRYGYINSRRDINTRVVHNTFIGDAFPIAGTPQRCFIGGAQVAPGTPWIECSNNIFYRTTANDGYISLTTALSIPAIMEGNCYFDTTGSNFAYVAGAIHATLPNWRTVRSRDLMSIEADPLLADPLATRDVHLLGASPCIGGGVTLTVPTAVDFEGDPRDMSPDIGVDEASASIVSVDTTPTQVAPGQTGIAVTVVVGNSSLTEDLDITSIGLTFMGTADRTSEYMVTPSPANPTTVMAGTTENFDFTVDVDTLPTEESITIDATVLGAFTPSATMITLGGSQNPDLWDVLGARPVARVVDATPTLVTPSSMGHQVDVDIENVGLTDWTVSSITLSFTGTADRTSQYTVNPAPGNPTMIAAGATETFTMMVDVSAMPTAETITIDVASASGVDQVTARVQSDTGADVTDTWDVVTCAATVCGDCNSDSVVSILDALTAARHAAALITLAGIAFTNCNVIGALQPDPLAAISILDALTLAQSAAGLPVVLACC